MAKYKYEYRCPSCGTQLEFKMRVTQTKRRCPQCGTPITPEEIDRQAAEEIYPRAVLAQAMELVIAKRNRQTAEEKDRQAAARKRQQVLGCLGFLGLIGVLAVIGAIIKSKEASLHPLPVVPQSEQNTSIKPNQKGIPTATPDKNIEPKADSMSEGGKKPQPKSPPMAKDKETRAAELLMSAEKAATEGNVALARVRCHLILEDYPDTKAATAAAKMLLETLRE